MENPAFEEYFREIYQNRWAPLKQALIKEPRKVVLSNPFGKLFQDYSLDEASLAPVRHLDLQPGQSVVDLCASPGGKSLAGIFALKGELGEWICNDLSPARVDRLKAVFHDCLPDPIFARVRIFRGDAARWGLKHKDHFDRVLADVPCSGERHLMSSAKELNRWSKKGSQRLTVRQHAILCAALDSCKSGGKVVYSTCSISPIENDGVIEKLCKSREGRFRILQVEDSMGEATSHGRLILPDQDGCGPIYFSVLEKL